MNWVQIIWSLAAGACILLALLHLTVWLQNRHLWANLCFCITVAGVLGIMSAEMVSMHTDSPFVFGRAFRWSHVVWGIGVMGSLGFVHFHLGRDSRRLLVAAIGSRALAMIMNFFVGANLHMVQVRSLQKITFLGAQVSVLRDWTPSRWAILAQCASLLQVLYIIDASIRAWRSHDPLLQRRALMIGAPLAFFIVFGTAIAGLVAAGILRTPFLVSLPFLAMLGAMGYELSRDVVHAAHLASSLRESHERIDLAVSAANLGLWTWRIDSNELWGTANARQMFGVPESGFIDFQQFMQSLRPTDRDALRESVSRALAGSGEFYGECQIANDVAAPRWIVLRGKVEFDRQGKPILMRGVSLDITQRKTEQELFSQQRNELAHVSRVLMLGELSSSLAHEINQPLMAILSNSQAAQEFLASTNPSKEELLDILHDITEQTKRASDVVNRFRPMLKRQDALEEPLDINQLVSEVLRLVRLDLDEKRIVVESNPGQGLPQILGVRVQLQQVLINLIINAADAMSAIDPHDRVLRISTRREKEMLTISIIDRGTGIPPDSLERIFDPLYTTKNDGMGMGLFVCRNIVSAHGGTLMAHNNPDRGGTFDIMLPTLAAVGNESAPANHLSDRR